MLQLKVRTKIEFKICHKPQKSIRININYLFIHSFIYWKRIDETFFLPTFY